MVNISFLERNYTITESNETVQVCAELTGILGRTVEVLISALPLSASESRDYTLNDSLLIFSPNVSSQCVIVTVIDDDIVEESEEVMLNLASNDSSVVISSPGVVVTIEDSSFVVVRFETSELEIQESDAVSLCVILEGESDRQIAVSVLVNDTGMYVSSVCL